MDSQGSLGMIDNKQTYKQKQRKQSDKSWRLFRRGRERATMSELRQHGGQSRGRQVVL